jgi:hypothetical protein
MIVRISSEDQYRLDAAQGDRLNQLDATVLEAVQAGDESAFEASFGALLRFVREEGARVGDDEIETSDVILPPADISLAEAEGEFTGDGLIPD